MVAYTGQIVGTLRVQLAFTLFTSDKCVSDVASGTGTDGPLGARAVVSGRALRVRTARVGLAQVTRFERPAEGERIAGHGLRAGADGRQTT